MKNIIDLYFNPGCVFQRIKEKPEWVLPIVVLLIVIVVITILTLSSSRDLIAAQQVEAMKERNMTDEQIEQAMKFSSGPLIFVFGSIGAVVSTVAILLIFAAILNLFIPMLGGEGSFKSVFSVVSYSALVKIPGNIMRLVLILIKNSLQVSTSLALFVPGLDTKSFAFKFLSGLDFFIFWEMLLVAYGIHITNNLKKENAYILVFAIWIVSIFFGILLSGLSGR